uniref:Uncharacterized protein n=1 Tax=Romanomermis culicivorax TaxID=13658 RepID=A0A915I5T1_ROMCU
MDKTKNATSTTTVISVTTTTGPPSETLFKNWYHRMEKLLEKFTNGTKDRLDEVRAEVQYCQAKIDFNKKLAETISGKRIFSLQTLKQSYDMIKQYWKLKEEGKKFKLCRDRSLLSWEVTVGRSWLKGLIIGSK